MKAVKSSRRFSTRYGLDPDNPRVIQAIVDWAVNTTEAEDGITGFSLYVLQNIESMSTNSASDFASMVTQWTSHIAEERPKAAEAVGQWGTTMIARMNEIIQKDGKKPAEAFLQAMGETLTPETSQKLAKEWGVEIPTTVSDELQKGKAPVTTAATSSVLNPVKETLAPKIGQDLGTIFGEGVTVQTVASLDAGKPKVETSATNITTAVGTKLKTGLTTVESEMKTNVTKAIVQPVIDAKPKVDTASTSLVKTFTDLGKNLWGALQGGFNAAVGAVSGAAQWLKDVLFGKGLQDINAQPMPTAPTAPTTGGAVPGGMTAQQVTALQTAWSTFSTSFATYKTSITTNLLAMQTAFSAFSTSMSTYVTGIQTKWSAFSTSFATYKTSITTNVLAIQTAFSTLSTSIGTYVGSISPKIIALTTQIGLFKVGATTNLVAVQTAFSTLSTSIATYTTSINTHIIGMTTQMGLFANSAKTHSTTVVTAMKGIQTASSTLSTTVSTHMKSMGSAVSSFASAFSSAMKKVQSDAKAATAAVKALQAAVNALKSKSITIHVGISGPGAAYLQHGGSFMMGQHGYGGVVNRPTSLGGVRMGEGFNPELVTVTPLTRGTGNHTGPTVGSTPMGGGGGSVVNNITVVLDGRVIQRFVEKTALSGVGMQV